MTSKAQAIMKLHEEAMEYADIAFFARKKGEEERFLKYSQLAFENEKSAALMIESENSEPTRSVFHRSAAVLALDCGKYREAEKLIGRALSGNPPGVICQELRELYETVKLELRLHQDGIQLDKNEIELSVNGNRVGSGFAPLDAVITRAKSIETLLRRTVCYLSSREFSDSIPTIIRENYGLYFGTTTPGSYNVVLKTWHPRQLDLPGLAEFRDLDEVIDTVMRNIELVSNGRFKKLEEKLPSPAYFRSFVGAARRIAPDGKNVSSVALSANVSGMQRQIAFNRKQSEIPTIPKTLNLHGDLQQESESISVIGSLRYADAINKNEVKLVDETGETWTVDVPEGSMEDVVRPYFGSTVNVSGKGSQARRHIRLDEIYEREYV